MKIYAKIFADLKYRTKNGYALKISVHEKKVKNPLYIKLHEYTEKEHWNDGLLKTHPNFRVLDSILKKREIKLSEEVKYCNDNNLSLQESHKVISEGIEDKSLQIFILKQQLKELSDVTSVIGILEFYDIRIAEIKNKGGSVKQYEETKKQFSKYLIDDEPINNVTYEWINEFINYKLRNGTPKPGIMTYLKNLRALYKEAQKRESLNIKKDNPFLGVIKTVSRTTDIIELSENDFDKLLAYEAPKSSTTLINRFKLERNVAIWLFQFVIGGHDYADVSTLYWKNVKGDRLRFKRFKNRNKPDGGTMIDIKLFDFAIKVIDLYGDRKDERIFPFIPHPSQEKNYANFRGNINRSLKKISETLELSSKVKTKSPRYLFRSRAGEMLIHDLIVMQIQGHKPTGVTFSYQSNISYQVQDKQHEMVIDFLLKD